MAAILLTFKTGIMLLIILLLKGWRIEADIPQRSVA